MDTRETFLSQVNLARYQGQLEGHYESFFLRANHPARPLAFWIRYTLFSPKSQPDQALGELWAVFFNGETGRHLALKQELPFSACAFSRTAFEVHVGGAWLNQGGLAGGIQSRQGDIRWQLTFGSDEEPLLLLPVDLYPGKFPAAKSLVSLPMARFNGTLTLDGEKLRVSDWVGSQNHNWGRRHTDRYAWGQVAGFDSHPDSFLEVATARLKLGPVWTPSLTLLVLRHRGKEYALNGLFQSIKARASLVYFEWNFKSSTPQVEVQGRIFAPRAAFVGLSYANPPGGRKHCLNTKIAACTLRVRDKVLGGDETLETQNRAAFELLTDDEAHGIPISA